MSEAFTLPAIPGDRQRHKPYAHLRTYNVPKAWRAVANRYNKAAGAWHRELAGIAPSGDYRVRDLATYRRLRQGQPSTFAEYDAARLEALATSSGNPDVLGEKLQLVAEILGLADPWRAWGKVAGMSSTDLHTYTRAEILFALLWKEAREVARVSEEQREEIKRLRKAARRA
ncbi:MAG: hypothetical protein V4597_18460 [Pseudomonadota bacterium]